MKEEENIFKKLGKDNPFCVPDGYFEHFTSEVMNQLPKKQEHNRNQPKYVVWRRINPLWYIAAMVIGVVFIVKVSSIATTNVKTDVAETDVVSDQLIDVAVDGAMMDDYSLYVYLTNANNEE